MAEPLLLDVLVREVESLDPEALDRYAVKLAPLIARLEARRPAPKSAEPDQWLTTKQAASYLGLSTHSVHRLTASRVIPFEQEGPRCRCWFKRSELDEWRRGQDRPDASAGTLRAA